MTWLALAWLGLTASPQTHRARITGSGLSTVGCPTAAALRLRDYVPNPGLLGTCPEKGHGAFNPPGLPAFRTGSDYYGDSVCLQRAINPPAITGCEADLRLADGTLLAGRDLTPPLTLNGLLSLTL